MTTSDGLTVTVGALGGNGDVGVMADPVGNATVTLGANNTINVGNASSTGIVGAVATSFGSDASVTAGDGLSINVTGDSAVAGVVAIAAGNATVTLGDMATVGNVTSTGITVVGNTSSTFDAGVLAIGGGNVTVTSGDTPITTNTGYGIALAASFGNVSVTDAGDITSGNADAILTAAGGSAVITLDGTGQVVTGQGNLAFPVISVSQTTGNSTTINIGSGTTESTNAGLPSDVAIGSTGTTGSVVVNNAGEVDGRMDFSSLTDVTGATVVNNSGDWFTQGNSTFGGGNVSANVVNNSGTIGTDFGSATFNNLAVLNNKATGVLELETGSATDDPTRGPVGSLTAPGTAYVGTAGSVIAEDAFLGGAGSTSDVLHVGSTSGTSSIFVFNENTGPAGYIPAASGIVLVSTTGANAANFTLDPASGGNGCATYDHGMAYELPRRCRRTCGCTPW